MTIDELVDIFWYLYDGMMYFKCDDVVSLLSVLTLLNDWMSCWNVKDRAACILPTLHIVSGFYEWCNVSEIY